MVTRQVRDWSRLRYVNSTRALRGPGGAACPIRNSHNSAAHDPQTSHETTDGWLVRDRARCVRRPARLQPQHREPKRRATGAWPMDRRRRLSVGDRHRMQSRGRVWPWPVPATDHPRRRYVRRRRHVPHRGWADRNRAGTARPFLWCRDRFTPYTECEAERIASAGVLLDDVGDCWNVPHSVRVAK